MSRRILKSHVANGITQVRRNLRKVQESVERGDATMAFTFAERAQMAAFNLKDYIATGDPEILKDGE